VFFGGFCVRIITCPSVLDALGIRVLVRNLRDFIASPTSIACSKCLVVSSALSANEISNNVKISDWQFSNINLLAADQSGRAV
jgi:hypothetical protein